MSCFSHMSTTNKLWRDMSSRISGNIVLLFPNSNMTDSKKKILVKKSIFSNKASKHSGSGNNAEGGAIGKHQLIPLEALEIEDG